MLTSVKWKNWLASPLRIFHVLQLSYRTYCQVVLIFGRESYPSEPNIAPENGFVARRKSTAGEELFSSHGNDDGGK